MMRLVTSRLTDDQKLGLRLQLARAQTVASAPFGSRLDLLARIFRTDKASGEHGYTAHYRRHLPARRAVRTLLEIGVGGVTSKGGYGNPTGGASLRLWQRYFPNAQIIGVDIERKVVPGPRIHIRQGSQDDPAFLTSVAAEFGPFDVIIDDGSHFGEHVNVSFETLFRYLRPGGLYVIEDLSTSYDPAYGGGPPDTPRTHSSLLRQLVDDVLRAHWATDGRPDVSALHVYDEIAFLQRA